jgi:hypothetical protein
VPTIAAYIDTQISGFMTCTQVLAIVSQVEIRAICPLGIKGAWMHGDWVTATATVLAAVIGILGGYLLARYQREKRVLRFAIMDTEDLAVGLREHGNFEIKFAHFSTTELILSTIVVRNIGNSSIRDIEFSIKIPGEHPFAQINCASSNPALASQVKVLPPSAGGTDPIFPVSLPFFNANETFRINALYVGKPSQCEVTCRLPDTTVEIYTLSELYRMSDRRSRWKFFLTVLAALGAATLMAFGGDLIRKLF